MWNKGLNTFCFQTLFSLATIFSNRQQIDLMIINGKFPTCIHNISASVKERYKKKSQLNWSSPIFTLFWCKTNFVKILRGNRGCINASQK